MHLAANAAMNLGYWDKLGKYVNQVDEQTDKLFWTTCIQINELKFEEARESVNLQLRKLDSQVSGLLLESHSRAYDSILRLQQLFEMEEIIQIKEYEHTVYKPGKDHKSELKSEITQEYDRRKRHI